MISTQWHMWTRTCCWSLLPEKCVCHCCLYTKVTKQILKHLFCFTVHICVDYSSISPKGHVNEFCRLTPGEIVYKVFLTILTVNHVYTCSCSLYRHKACVLVKSSRFSLYYSYQPFISWTEWLKHGLYASAQTIYPHHGTHLTYTFFFE